MQIKNIKMTRIKSRFDLTGKVAIVTGSSKGKVEAMVRGLAEFGAKVVVSSRKQEAVDAVAAELVKDGYDAVGIECHIAKEDHRKQLIDKTIEKYGRVDILINNAGTNPYYGPISEMSYEVYQKTMAVNLDAAMQLSNLVYPHMKSQGGGSIIHVSSIEGLHATELMAAYNVSKAGLIMLGKNQAAEWGRDNIRVNMICPGLVKTKLSAALFMDDDHTKKICRKIPLKRYAMPDEMAGLACFLASDAGSYCTGSVIVNDGGILLAPLF
jgi:NAD(P)-dependent dehydrogenase (short-subunit alcohol dehydrogenase family)